MEQYFWVIFDTNRKIFYQNSQFGYTDDMLLAEQYKSYHAANEKLRYLKKDSLVIRKVTVTLEK